MFIDSALHSDLRSALHSALHSALRSALHSALHSALRSALHSALRSALHSALRSALHSALRSALRSALHSALHSARSRPFYQHLGDSKRIPGPPGGPTFTLHNFYTLWAPWGGGTKHGNLWDPWKTRTAKNGTVHNRPFYQLSVRRTARSTSALVVEPPVLPAT